MSDVKSKYLKRRRERQRPKPRKEVPAFIKREARGQIGYSKPVPGFMIREAHDDLGNSTPVALKGGGFAVFSKMPGKVFGSKVKGVATKKTPKALKQRPRSKVSTLRRTNKVASVAPKSTSKSVKLPSFTPPPAPDPRVPTSDRLKWGLGGAAGATAAGLVARRLRKKLGSRSSGPDGTPQLGAGKRVAGLLESGKPKNEIAVRPEKGEIAVRPKGEIAVRPKGEIGPVHKREPRRSATGTTKRTARSRQEKATVEPVKVKSEARSETKTVAPKPVKSKVREATKKVVEETVKSKERSAKERAERQAAATARRNERKKSTPPDKAARAAVVAQEARNAARRAKETLPLPDTKQTKTLPDMSDMKAEQAHHEKTQARKEKIKKASVPDVEEHPKRGPRKNKGSSIVKSLLKRHRSNVEMAEMHEKTLGERAKRAARKAGKTTPALAAVAAVGAASEAKARGTNTVSAAKAGGQELVDFGKYAAGIAAATKAPGMLGQAARFGASKASPVAAALFTGVTLGEAGRELYKGLKASREARRQQLKMQKSYGTIEAATATRKRRAKMSAADRKQERKDAVRKHLRNIGY